MTIYFHLISEVTSDGWESTVESEAIGCFPRRHWFNIPPWKLLTNIDGFNFITHGPLNKMNGPELPTIVSYL